MLTNFAICCRWTQLLQSTYWLTIKVPSGLRLHPPTPTTPGWSILMFAYIMFVTRRWTAWFSSPTALTEHMQADLLTKPLPRPAFEKLRTLLGLIDPRSTPMKKHVGNSLVHSRTQWIPQLRVRPIKSNWLVQAWTIYLLVQTTLIWQIAVVQSARPR